MKEEVTIKVDGDLKNQFEGVMKLVNSSLDDAIVKAMNLYIFDALKEFDQLKGVGNGVRTKSAKDKIAHWASKPNQNNHKILRAFLMLKDENKKVKKVSLEHACGSVGFVGCYVKNFLGNYNSMKSDNPNANGKVFEDDGTYVYLTKEVEQEVLKYKNQFVSHK